MKVCLGALAIIFLAACTSSYESTTQQADDGAYIRLSGNFMGTELTINDQAPIRLREGSTRTFRLDNERVALFELSPGAQRIRITRDSELIVNRELYVGRGNTIAIRVP
ncbi:MAG: hypothetical protein JJU03_06420 [Idiomarina sp.]|nr:hypothetical protein [Idiomarina sp.]